MGSAGFSGLDGNTHRHDCGVSTTPFRANRLANIIAGGFMTLVNAVLTFVLPLTNGDYRDPTFPAYVFFALIETVCTSVIIWQAWTWLALKPAGSSERTVGNPELVA